MAKITATRARKPRRKPVRKSNVVSRIGPPIREEATYVLGKTKGSDKLHVLLQLAGGHVTLCTRKESKVDARRKHTSKDDITCPRCKRELAQQLEATG